MQLRREKQNIRNSGAPKRSEALMQISTGNRQRVEIRHFQKFVTSVANQRKPQAIVSKGGAGLKTYSPEKQYYKS
jgi:hypothetical protein